MISYENSANSDFVHWVKSLPGRLHNCDAAWRCCNCL